jgi:DNA-binding protein H-NS
VQAARIKLEATNLIEQHRQLMEDVNKERREAEKLLEEGIEQQQVRVHFTMSRSSDCMLIFV